MHFICCQIVNPLSGLVKPKVSEVACNITPTPFTSTSSTTNTLSSTAKLIAPPVHATISSMSSSIAELIANMASTTMNDVSIPPTANGKQTFVQLLSDSIASANTAVDSSSVMNFDVAATKATKTLLKKKDPHTTKETYGWLGHLQHGWHKHSIGELLVKAWQGWNKKHQDDCAQTFYCPW